MTAHTGNSLPKELLKFSFNNARKILIFCVLCFGISIHSTYAQAPLTDIAAISASKNFSCSLNNSGGVECWGDNTYGQLGNGSQVNRWGAVNVIGLSSGVTAIATGGYHACAITNTGGVKCWGDNRFGQLGAGVNSNQTTPTDNTVLSSGVVAITAGFLHTCALTTSGIVKCWGNNDRGQLGAGSNSSSFNFNFNNVGNLPNNVISIAAGTYHTCALTSAGGVKCWGDNTYNQLGNGTRTSTFLAEDIPGLNSGVTQLSVGGLSACAVLTAGTVKCWGYEGNGQIGNNIYPIDIVGFQSAIRFVSVGSSSKCAITLSGGSFCWGFNGDGELGDGTQTSSNMPVAVLGLSTATSAISVGDSHACAITDGGVKCWGRGWEGELGDNTTTGSLFPTVTQQSPLTPNPPTIGIATAGNGQAIVRFTPPTNGGGAPITGYTVTSNWGDGTDTQAGTINSYTGPSDFSHLITGLMNGRGYLFRVTATNALGTSLPSELSNVVIPTANTSSVASQSSTSRSTSSSSISSSVNPSSIASSSLSSASSVINICTASTTINLGSSNVGALATNDCNSGARGLNYYNDKYSFTGQSGQQIAITLTSTSFDTYVYLKSSSGALLTSNDDGGGGTNSRIPANSGFYTLPSSGTYTIEVTSYSMNTIGSYSLTTSIGATSSSSTSSSSSSTSSTPNTCAPIAAVSGTTYNGTLSLQDCTSGARGTSYYVDRLSVNAVQGQQITIQLSSGAFDTFVYLKNPNGTVIASNDDGGGGTNSRIPATSGTFTIPSGISGPYVIEVTSYSTFSTGAYNLTLTLQ